MSQFGYAERDQVNVGGDFVIHYPPASPALDDDHSDPSGPDEPSGGKGGAAAGGGGLVVVLLGIAGLYLHNAQEPFPTTGDQLPQGSDAVVLASVSNWLETCAKAVVAKPVNCPQAVDATSVPDAAVTWSLYGDAVEGARIRFNKSENRFDVLGSAIMAGRYQVAGNGVLDVQPLYYWAKLDWRDGRAEVVKIERYKADPEPANQIEKRNPNIAWEAVSAAVRQTFQWCAGWKGAPLPAGCPSSPAFNLKDTAATWKLDSDPLLTARPIFDSKHGLIHVKGSYALTAHYKGATGKRATMPQIGNYDALVVSDAGLPVVLDVQDDQEA